MGGRIFVGLMSGTSIDGVDAIVADFTGARPVVLASHHLPFTADLRARLLELARPFPGELDAASEAGLALAEVYAEASLAAIGKAGLAPAAISAIGCHGQTVRHRPERGYTLQIGAPALLAERTGIQVVADFRAADLAAGGQGAPLAPGFHAAILADPAIPRVVLNLGGIANITRLVPGQRVIGFDCGPANILMDAWTERHLQRPFDRDGHWARSGHVLAPLLRRMLAEHFFVLPPPKSTGRDLFDIDWLQRHLAGDEAPADVQATLLALTATTVADAIRSMTDVPGVPDLADVADRGVGAALEVVACGGGAFNGALMEALAARLAPARTLTSADLGLAPEAIEPLAFAWLASARLDGQPGNLPDVTGASGPRVLGAVYPAPS
ncbi:MAG: anhydro-N-acetylmuramic acid kinase [bacterium]